MFQWLTYLVRQRMVRWLIRNGNTPYRLLALVMLFKKVLVEDNIRSFIIYSGLKVYNE